MLGPFLWGRRARVEGTTCTWFTGERHERAVEVAAGRLVVSDTVRGDGAELTWALAPGAEARVDGTRATVTSGATAAVLDGEGIAPWRLEPAEAAPRFARRQPALRLVAAISGERCRTTITLARR
jgi:hypothetical protein